MSDRQIYRPTMAEAARMMNVSERSVRFAGKVRRDGVPELVAMVESGDLSVSTGALLAGEPADRQREILASTPPRKIRAALLGPATGAPCPHCDGTGRVGG